MRLHRFLCWLNLHAWKSHRRGPKHSEAWSDCGVCGKLKNVVLKVKTVETPLFDQEQA